MANDHEPLTVIEIDHQITDEEAERIRQSFMASVKDDRPLIILGPNARAFELEPYTVAYRRAAIAFVVALVAVVIAIVAMTIMLIMVVKS